MEVSFVKYQGTGNDFIMIDNRSGKWDALTITTIQSLCDRKFGVGADGLIKINSHTDFAFEVDYYNSDGSKSFCGNGARCAVAFAKTLGINASDVQFQAIDGMHEASEDQGIVSLRMNDVSDFSMIHHDFVLDTGSPHYIRFVDYTKEYPVVEEGQKIRFSDTYEEEGINVNFVHETIRGSIEVLTYERGVEDETLSCGTGVTAAAIALAVKNELFGCHTIEIRTKGGKLEVKLNRIAETTFTDIYLVGPAVRVFEGVYHG